MNLCTSEIMQLDAIEVFDDGAELLSIVRKVSMDFESPSTALEELERKFVSSFAERVKYEAKAGWLLGASAGEKLDQQSHNCVRKYTPYQLRSTLQIMGLKQLHAHDVACWTFSTLENLCRRLTTESGVQQTFKTTTQESSVELSRKQFIMLMGYALLANERCRRKHLRDFVMSCELREQRMSLTILFGGTSGCGKSTLASLIGSRLGVTTVVSTDFVRHMLRRFANPSETPLLFSSTYTAGQCLSNEEVETTAEHYPTLSNQEARVLAGYEGQSRLIFESLDRVISSYEERRECLIVEGVHLSSENMASLMRRHPSCIPFLVYISNVAKHKERFAVRAKYMALDSRTNRYVKHIDNIRVIQRSLEEGADRLQIPKIDNTNMDRSLGTIHAVVLKCLRKRFKGAPLWDEVKGHCNVIQAAYEQHHTDAWSSKAMLKTIRSKISKGEVLKRYFEAVPPIQTSPSHSCSSTSHHISKKINSSIIDAEGLPFSTAWNQEIQHVSSRVAQTSTETNIRAISPYLEEIAGENDETAMGQLSKEKLVEETFEKEFTTWTIHDSAVPGLAASSGAHRANEGRDRNSDGEADEAEGEDEGATPLVEITAGVRSRHSAQGRTGRAVAFQLENYSTITVPVTPNAHEEHSRRKPRRRRERVENVDIDCRQPNRRHVHHHLRSGESVQRPTSTLTTATEEDEMVSAQSHGGRWEEADGSLRSESSHGGGSSSGAAPEGTDSDTEVTVGESEEESEGHETLDLEADTCSWAPSVEAAQVEESEGVESSVGVVRGSAMLSIASAGSDDAEISKPSKRPSTAMSTPQRRSGKSALVSHLGQR